MVCRSPATSLKPLLLRLTFQPSLQSKQTYSAKLTLTVGCHGLNRGRQVKITKKDRSEDWWMAEEIQRASKEFFSSVCHWAQPQLQGEKTHHSSHMGTCSPSTVKLGQVLQAPLLISERRGKTTWAPHGSLRCYSRKQAKHQGTESIHQALRKGDIGVIQGSSC